MTLDDEPNPDNQNDGGDQPDGQTSGGGGGDQTTGATFVRREISSLAAGDETVSWYAKGVAAMQQRPDGDPTSWSYQAAIHGTHAASPPPGANGCKHGSWYFVAWHRMYLLHFEEIVRAAIVAQGGPADWTLPYWNYGLGGDHATLPEAFRSPTLDGGGDNPLFVAERADGINDGAGIPDEVTSPDFALSRDQFTGSPQFGGGTAPAGPQFQSRTGRVEQTPHNDMHNALGGPSGLMSDPDQAALDPIFWLHHGNVDRLWDQWSTTGSHADPTDPAWVGQSFDFFGADGATLSQTCGSVVDIASLGYAYDTSTPRTEEMAMTAGPQREPEDDAELVGASEQPTQLTGAAATVPVTIDARASAGTLESTEPPTVYLNVEDIEADKNPGSVYGIYVNLPDGATADVAAQHHVGNLSFFGIERAVDPKRDGESHGLKVTIDITDLVARLTEQGQWDEATMHVTFRPHRLIAAGGDGKTVEPAADEHPVTVGRVSLFYG